MKNGFTLVELSIVLVIIGLLVGGVLVGQSLIDSAKVNSFVREWQQYKIMVDQFEDRYRSLPGDTRLFEVTGRGTAVAGDKVIHSSVINNVNNFTGEIAHFWKHLSDGNMTQEEYSADASSGIVAGMNTPEMVYDNAAPVPILVDGPSHAFMVGDYSARTDDSTAGSAALSAIEALAIDSKIDDGLAITNSFSGVGGFENDDTMFGVGGNNCWQTSPASGPVNYNTSDPDARCVFFIRYK